MEATGDLRHGVDVSFKILTNSSVSQAKIHSAYGGVYPMLAKREHIKNLPILLDKVLRNAGFSRERSLAQAVEPSRDNFQQKIIRAKSATKSGIDAIAVTSGPGLEPSLWTGITFAKELAQKWNVPLVPVNHMEGHVLSPFGKNKGKFSITLKKEQFPVLALLVSGGHTQLILMRDWFKYKIIGETLDDAVGEAFDKVARMLELPYPGGPQISKFAEQERLLRSKLAEKMRANLLLRTSSQAVEPRKAIRQQADMRGEKKQFASIMTLPRPMLYTKNFDFSFSGLKTAVLYKIRDLNKQHSNILQNDKMKQIIALEFENAAIECLTHKTTKAIKKYNIRTMLVAGGVAANTHLRNEMKKLTKKEKVGLMFPTRELSTDNAIMIGMAGYLNYIQKPKKKYKIRADGSLRLGKMIK